MVSGSGGLVTGVHCRYQLTVEKQLNSAMYTHGSNAHDT